MILRRPMSEKSTTLPFKSSRAAMLSDVLLRDNVGTHAGVGRKDTEHSEGGRRLFLLLGGKVRLRASVSTIRALIRSRRPRGDAKEHSRFPCAFRLQPLSPAFIRFRRDQSDSSATSRISARPVALKYVSRSPSPRPSPPRRGRS